MSVPKEKGMSFPPSLLDEEVVFAETEVLRPGSDEIFATGVPNAAENVVASDLVQQSKETRLASQHHEPSSSRSQSRTASLPAAVPSAHQLATVS